LGSDSAITILKFKKRSRRSKRLRRGRRVIVGNEVVAAQRSHARAAQRLCRAGQEGVGRKIDVGTADVWNTWLANPEIARNCDFIAIHILPYWDGVTAAESTAYIKKIYARVLSRSE